MPRDTDLQKTLQALRNDPLRFVQDLWIPSAYGDVRFGDVMVPFQLEWFQSIAPSLVALTKGESPPIGRFWCERSKGGSKDNDLSVCLLHLLLTSRRTQRIPIAAYDQDQADEVRLIVKGILKIDAPLNRLLREFITVQSSRIINEATGSYAECLTRDSLGTHGGRYTLAICNELTHVADESFMQTIVDNVDKLPNTVLVIATNAGHIGSWQERWKQIAVESDRWHVHEVKEPAPWISREDLQESRKRNPVNRYRRLWCGQWVSESSGALSDDVIDRAIVPSLSEQQPERGWSYCIGCDIGVRRDATAAVCLAKSTGFYEEHERQPRLSDRRKMLVECGILQMPESTYTVDEREGTGRLRVVAIRTWYPEPGLRVDLDDVERAIRDLCETYKAVVGFDPTQAEQMMGRLRKEGCEVVSVDFTSKSLTAMCSNLLEVFNEGLIEIPDHENLTDDLRRMLVKEGPTGFRLVSPRGSFGHGDCVTALSIAGLLSRDIERYTTPVIRRELVCFP